MADRPPESKGDQMKIEIEVPSSTIANMMVSAVESGDPVTSAHKGGWCSGIALQKGPTAGLWYANESLYEGAFVLQVFEYHEETDTKTKHAVTPQKMAAGLAVMAKVFPDQFAQVMRDDTDAPCADAFLQSILFGKEKYA